MVDACWVTVGLAVAGVCLLYSWATRTHDYWAKRGVAFIQPLPFFGTMLPTFLKTQSFAKLHENYYHQMKQHGLGGLFEFMSPTLIITDPDIIRDVTVKHFDHFMDRRSIAGQLTNDPLFHRALPNLKGQEWKRMRNRLSPAFTTSKLRGMFPLISRCGEQFSRFLVTRIDADTEPLEFKSTFTRLTNDVIASVAFGLECTKMLVIFGYMLIPRLMHFLNISFTPKKVSTYFNQLIQGAMLHREKSGETRPDMLQLLMAAQKGGIESAHGDEQDAGTVGEAEDAAAMHRKHLAPQDQDNKTPITDEDIAAQASVFFFAGYETVATLMSFMAHELAINPDMQERLRSDIDAAILENDGQLTYDAILQMKYLDMVVSETLRKFPPAGFTDRHCIKCFKVPGSDLVIEKGTKILLPMFPMHRDPEYFPDPERFDPERFNEENKKNIKPYTYLPFGSGPHNCIGMRFALLEAKVCMAHVLATCELRVSAKTEVPLQLSKKSFMMTTDAGFWLTCMPRTNPTMSQARTE